MKSKFTALFALIVLAQCLFFYVKVSPHLGYGYDIDASDGDFLNMVNRLLAGKPMYLKLSEGTALLLYGPVYFFVLAPLRGLAANFAVAARWFNFLVFGGWLCLMADFSRKYRRSSFQALPWVVLALFFHRWSVFTWLVNIRTDALAVGLVLLALWVHQRWPVRSALVAVVAVLAVFTKQTMVSLPVALLVHHACFDRAGLKRFVAAGVAVSLAIVMPMEWWNQGEFLKSLFIYPSQVFSGEMLTWEHFFYLFKYYYELPYLNALTGYGAHPPILEVIFCLALLGGAVAGAVIAFRRGVGSLRVLALLWFFDLLFFVKFGRNIGGGHSYLWLHWCLTILLSGLALDEGLVWREKRASSARREAWVLSLAVVLPLALYSVPNLVTGFAHAWAEHRHQTAQYALQTSVLDQQTQAVAELARTNPAGHWFTTRYSMPLVASGQLLDQEGSTLAFAFAHEDRFDPKKFIHRFLDGEYHFVQRNRGWEILPAVNQVLDACYLVKRELDSYEAERPSRVALMEFDGSRAECKSFAAKMEKAFTP